MTVTDGIYTDADRIAYGETNMDIKTQRNILAVLAVIFLVIIAYLYWKFVMPTATATP